MSDLGADPRLRDLRTEWERLAERDAFHAVLSDPARSDGGWDAEAFYASGRYTVDLLVRFVEDRGLTLRRGRALDFGCGAGRLAFALAAHFEQVVGVDISAPMIDRAREHGVPENCDLIVQYTPDLPALEGDEFDFVFSVLVIQHMEPDIGCAYLSALAHKVAPGGALLCQVPYGHARRPPGAASSRAQRVFRSLAPGFLVARRRRHLLRRDVAVQREAGEPAFELHCISRRKVRSLLEAAGLEIVDVEGGHDYDAPPLVSAWYVARRPE